MTFDELCHAARRTPTQPAFLFNGSETPNAAFLDAVAATAEAFRDRSLRPGDCVAIAMPNSPATAAAILACIREKLLCLLLDPALKAPEIAQHCRRARARCILSPASSSAGETIPPAPHLPIAPPVDREGPCPRGPSGNHPVYPPSIALLDPTSAAPAHPAALTADGGFLLLSSGTSGAPKLVLRTLPQAFAALDIFASRIPLDPSDRVLGSLPFFHSFGLLYVLLSSIRSGACLILEPFSPRSTLRTVERERVTVLPASPFMFRLLSATRFERPPDLRAVRLAVSAGSALPEAVSAAFHSAFGLGIAQSYGTTETGPATIGMPGERIDAPGWVGRPYGGVTIHCPTLASRPDDASRCASLVVQSPAIAAGYIDAPEATALVFRPGGVDTGDLGYSSPSGDIFVLGRERPIISVAGKKVAPSEVEACLRAHPLVVDVLVTSVATGDGGGLIRATLVTREEVSPAALRAHCAAHLADFKIPREFRFAETLGEGPMGKTRITGYSPPP